MNNSKQKLIIIGAGGHAKVVLATALANRCNVIGLLDDNPELLGQKILGHSILTNVKTNFKIAKRAVFGLGNNRLRKKLIGELIFSEWQTLIHPTAYVHPSAQIGEGTVVFAGCVIQPDVQIGKHCIINTGVTIDHDCKIDDYAHLAPGVHVAGGVRIDEGTFLGIGSIVIPQIHIGEWVVVAAGGVVVDHVAANKMIMGVPAKERITIQCKI